MTTALTTPMNFTQEQIRILQNTVGKGIEQNEFLFMLELAKRYELDPFARQIYCTKVGIIVSRDGYMAILHRNPNFDGIRTEFVDDEKGNPITATTTVWLKGISHPFVETAYWSEYNKGTQVWNQYKHPMLQKCSERMAISKACSITGLYSDAELCTGNESIAEFDEEAIDVTPEPVTASEPEPAKAEPVKQPVDKCPVCGKEPMVPTRRKEFETAFQCVGYGEVPAGLCEKCARDLWKQKMTEEKK